MSMDQQQQMQTEMSFEMSIFDEELESADKVDAIDIVEGLNELSDQCCEIRATKRYKRLLMESSNNLLQKDFSPYPSVLPFQLPAAVEDFDIPDNWKKMKKQVDYPRYRTLHKSSYRLPLVRGSCCTDDLPQCSCRPQEECGAECQNRLLFM